MEYLKKLEKGDRIPNEYVELFRFFCKEILKRKDDFIPKEIDWELFANEYNEVLYLNKKVHFADIPVSNTGYYY